MRYGVCALFVPEGTVGATRMCFTCCIENKQSIGQEHENVTYAGNRNIAEGRISISSMSLFMANMSHCFAELDRNFICVELK